MSQKDPKLTFAAQSIRLSWGRLWRVALSKTGRANPGEMLAPWFPYKGDAAMIGNETGRRGKPSSVQKPQGGFFDAHFWEHPHRTLSRCAMTLAIQSLITNRCRELGLGQGALVRLCGYRNIPKGLRRLGQLCAGDFQKGQLLPVYCLLCWKCHLMSSSEPSRKHGSN